LRGEVVGFEVKGGGDGGVDKIVDEKVPWVFERH
jgi:hypothetical protein